jgi:hypothetical protein
LPVPTPRLGLGLGRGSRLELGSGLRIGSEPSPTLTPPLTPTLTPTLTRWYPHAASTATEAMLRQPRTDAVPLSVEAVEWVLSEQPGQRMSVSALNDVFQTQTKPERERLAALVAQVATVA